MFVNLHTLPAGHHMYTVYLAKADEVDDLDSAMVDEYDIVGLRGLDKKGVLALLDATPDFVDLYTSTDPEKSGLMVVGIVNQNMDAVVYDIRTSS